MATEPAWRQPSDDSRLCYRRGCLHLGETSLGDLVQELNTPFFLFSEARLRANYLALRQGLAASGLDTVIRYCAKTNNEAGVLKTLADLDSHCLVCHCGELDLALLCGFPAHRLAFQRPVAAPEELREVAEAGVALAHAHRPEDLPPLERAAAKGRRTLDVSLRLRPRRRLLDGPLGGLGRRFGFSNREVLEAVDELRRLPHLRLAAVNGYLGTQRGSPEDFRVLVRQSLSLIEELQHRFGLPAREVNLGGGIPSPSLERQGLRRLRPRSLESSGLGDPVGRLARFATRLGEIVAREVARHRFAEPPTLAVEPGRSIVGNAGLLVTRVRAVRDSWLFVDASANWLAESRLLFRRSVLPLDPISASGEHVYQLSGSTLNTMDVVDFRRRLPRMEVGSVLVFCDAGAYTISRASRYGGLAPGAWMLRGGGAVEQIRHPERPEHLRAPMRLD